MEENLEKLAIAKRRLTSYYPSEEVGDEEMLYRHMAFYEAEDRKSGNFPYDDDKVQTITDFYKGKDILITGGTGYVGKVLIEKILRSIPKGGRIFLLIRGRKGLTPQQRVKAMLGLPLFKLVMTENPKAAERLVAIEGDCSSFGLGLSQPDRQTIIDNVSVVFHCAATVRFHLPLSFVILMNTRGAREVVYLCKELNKLDAFVHVSTAYTCATKDRTTPIPEEVLPASVDWRTVIAAAEQSIKSSKSSSSGFDLIFEKLQSNHLTNYTFSKLLAENIVEEECKGLPAIIVRPTVLLATYEDPFGGWIDNMYGPFAIWSGIIRGVVRTNYGNRDTALDFLPVDFLVKTMITAAWHRGLNFRMRQDPEKMDVVNNCSSNYIKKSFRSQWVESSRIMSHVVYRYALRYPRFYMTTNYWIFWFITVTSQIPLGVLVDTSLKLCGKKPMLLNVYRRIFFAQTQFLFGFCTHEFHFHDNGQWVLQTRMPKEDKARFSWISKYFSLAYEVDIISGIITFIFKETPVPIQQSNVQTMLIVDWIHNAILVGLGLWIFSLISYGTLFVFLLFVFGFIVINQ